MNECKRCGKEFENPIPEIKKPDGNKEIATIEWCAECNEFAMSILYRGRSAYDSPKLGRQLNE